MSYYHFAGWQFDPHSGELKNADTTSQLRHKVASLLSYLLQHRQRIISKEELLNQLWQHGEFRENALTQSVRELRKALGDQAQQPTFIRTFPQRGYQWICPVSASPGSNALEADTSATESDSSKALPAHGLPEQVRPEQIRPEQAQPDKAQAEKAAPENSIADTRPLFSKGVRARLPQLSLVTVALLALIVLVSWWPTPDVSGAEEGVLILPFSNQTGDNSQDWVQLGLADMVFVALQQRSQHRLIAPHQARQWLAQSGVVLPAVPMTLQGLLNEYQLGAALQASVRQHQGQQVLDFQLIFADGRQQQGSISYPSLAASSEAVAQQLQRLLQPDMPAQPTMPKAQDPVAATAMAEGISALQHQGAQQAQRYFTASQVIEPENIWIQALTAHAQVLTGDWHQAEQQLLKLAQQTVPTMLSAYVHYWLAELRWRQGVDAAQIRPLLEKTLALARQSQDQERIVATYQLESRLAWQQNDWQAHHLAIEKMQQHLPPRTHTAMHADSLFYRGNPAEVGLERSPLNDLQHNAQHLQQALNLYQQLGQTPDIVASQFALARNFSLPLEQRQQHLQQALDGYQQLRYPYELMQVQLYAGYFHMQLHQGDIAEQYFLQATELANQLGSHHWQQVGHFYQSFALLDQGLDQQQRGGHSQRPEFLHQAISAFEQYLAGEHNPYWHAAARIFLGWAHNDLGNYEQAASLFAQAYEQNQRLNMPVSAAYADFSWMYAQLQMQQPQAVIERAAERAPSTRLQARYLARAWHETGNNQQAAQVLAEFAERYPQQWQAADEQRLNDYRRTAQPSVLAAELMPHLVYCESDWELPELSQLLSR
ncbi:hypothetical protein CHH28_08415 [Bacterioplanes sanyensis]|uniref:OmpR/PhoB-type domain-containing protein n=1 Tax=Bacterioplanes sanyensis TaxID=1249553 RepID=A0A222FJ78_9GAMM|nr:winged helix-turn-helix domain-containing protein [Bacterioplanes sanyensis]ASP38702.1 hypothetical protein CHH28_08415 [Bacterioplanes sanyensis]